MNCKFCNRELINKSALKSHEKTCEKIILYKDEIIRLYTEELISINNLANKYKMGMETLFLILKNVIRTHGETNKLIRKKYPERYNYKVTEETKIKISNSRKIWMKNNPYRPWLYRKNMSYPEKLFYNKLIELEYDKKYYIIRERYFQPYFIDFAFEDYKLAVEIDGSQHLLPERIESDNKKNNLLIENNWSVIRFSVNEIKKNLDNCFKIIEEKLKNLEKNELIRVGIIKERKNYKKKKNEFGFTKEQINYYLNRRKIKDRPSLEQLELDIKELGCSGTGRKYNVSDTCINKWIKRYKNNINDKFEIINENKEIINNDIEKYKIKIIRKKQTELTEKQKQSYYNNRKVKERPDLQSLQTLLENNSSIEVAKMFNVSKSVIYGWIRQYKK